jgi:hypothetical protein
MSFCIAVKNLFNYDPLIPPPYAGADCFYLTDNQKSVPILERLGWKRVVFYETPSDVPKEKKREYCRDFRIYPERYIPEIANYHYVLMTDANVRRLNRNIGRFVRSCGDLSMVVDDSYYSLHRNNLEREFDSSLASKRWSYQHDRFRQKREEYSQAHDLSKIPVCSAKYMVFNNRNRNEELLSFLLEEWRDFLQGNIIVSIASEKFPLSVKRGKLPRPNKIVSHLAQH